MASTVTELPPMGKISMIGIWIETMLYGVNLVAYGLCMYSLFRRGKGTRLVLKVTCIVIFILCTVHVVASLRQLLDAFIYTPSDVPDYSTIYWLNHLTPLCLLKNTIYVTLVLAQDFILIWRLYVVFVGNGKVIVLPIIFAATSVGCIYASLALSDGPLTIPLVITAWVSGLILNVLASGGIIARLWWTSRRIASLTATSTNRFTSSMYVVTESSAITVVCGATVFALFVWQSSLAVSSLDITVQLIVLSPFLIVLQAGKMNPYHFQSGDLSPKTSTATTLDEMTFRARVVVPRELASTWRDDDSLYIPSMPSAPPDARM